MEAGFLQFTVTFVSNTPFSQFDLKPKGGTSVIYLVCVCVYVMHQHIKHIPIFKCLIFSQIL